jgi:hypothetical protein
MEFKSKGEVTDAPEGYLPWFAVPGRKSADHVLVTGHWSALGLKIEPNLLALDSGCLWGRHLTAVRLPDRKVYQVDCSGGGRQGELDNCVFCKIVRGEIPATVVLQDEHALRLHGHRQRRIPATCWWRRSRMSRTCRAWTSRWPAPCSSTAEPAAKAHRGGVRAGRAFLSIRPTAPPPADRRPHPCAAALGERRPDVYLAGEESARDISCRAWRRS